MARSFEPDGFMMAELAEALESYKHLNEAPEHPQTVINPMEVPEEESELVDRARGLALARATYTGRQIYIGSTPWGTDFYSPWYPIADVTDKPEISIQAQLKRTHELTGHSGILQAQNAPTVTLNARYQHSPTEVTSGVHPLFEFDDEGLTVYRAPDQRHPDPFKVRVAEVTTEFGVQQKDLEKAAGILDLIEQTDPSTGIRGFGFPFV